MPKRREIILLLYMVVTNVYFSLQIADFLKEINCIFSLAVGEIHYRKGILYIQKNESVTV